MNKHSFQIFAFVFIFLTLSETVIAHEFDSLGILVRHKANNVSLIAAPSLAALETNQHGEKINFDTNGDGQISFEEMSEFENEIAIRIEQLVVFRDEAGRVAKLQSIRLLEKGYENLLKIAVSGEQQAAQNSPESGASDQASYIQISVKFQWDNEPQSIHLYYGLLTDDDKNLLVRDQNIGQSQIIVLASSKPNIQVFPISTDTHTNTKPIWILGIEHVLEGLDHLLFILALTLVCKSWLGLVAPLSAFTLTHSFALALVAFGVNINISSWIIETGIAMTIVVMALFELFGWRPKRLFLVTSVMGIIHGFGLGQALTDSLGGIDGWAIALVQVTVGIELTQLAIALLFLAVIIYLPRLVKVSHKKLEFGISGIIVCVGFFWAVERVLS